ncbi:unnamed protein product [Medioppia subpectinata]|uniref:Uncharacterized protein n=1 Tax=Medioppia subpectinata TaxID=1979941 RepID=A0A7R9KWR2_9ACAR|nr:unnamed protein product [Medioppia subpectinata]CAG2110901.1 unnamed protein product [Medioppia subpectinata]
MCYCNSSLTTKNTINTSAEELREQIRDIEYNVTNNIFAASNEESPELPVIPVFRELIDYKGLNQLECNRMRELMTASNVFNYRLNNEKIVKEILGLEKMIVNYSHLNEKFVTDLISFAQHLMAFNTICPNDRLALVKYGGKDLILRSVQIDLCMFEQKHYNSLKYYYGQFILVWDYGDPIIINLDSDNDMRLLALM